MKKVEILKSRIRAKWKRSFNYNPDIIAFLDMLVEEAFEEGVDYYPYIWKRNNASYMYKKVKLVPSEGEES